MAAILDTSIASAINRFSDLGSTCIKIDTSYFIIPYLSGEILKISLG